MLLMHNTKLDCDHSICTTLDNNIGNQLVIYNVESLICSFELLHQT